MSEMPTAIRGPELDKIFQDILAGGILGGATISAYKGFGSFGNILGQLEGGRIALNAADAVLSGPKRNPGMGF